MGSKYYLFQRRILREGSETKKKNTIKYTTASHTIPKLDSEHQRSERRV